MKRTEKIKEYFHSAKPRELVWKQPLPLSTLIALQDRLILLEERTTDLREYVADLVENYTEIKEVI